MSVTCLRDIAIAQKKKAQEEKRRMLLRRIYDSLSKCISQPPAATKRSHRAHRGHRENDKSKRSGSRESFIGFKNLHASNFVQFVQYLPVKVILAIFIRSSLHSGKLPGANQYCCSNIGKTHTTLSCCQSLQGLDYMHEGPGNVVWVFHRQGYHLFLRISYPVPYLNPPPRFPGSDWER
ncbi:hypothetical protein ES703_53886 [subsurface metagenome]